jgi:hypothetical protein
VAREIHEAVLKWEPTHCTALVGFCHGCKIIEDALRAREDAAWEEAATGRKI